MIKIVTDIPCSLDNGILAEHGITAIPTYVTFGNETFRDRVELSPQEFYKRLATSKELPSTNQPSVADFEAVYQRLASEGAKTILSIHLSASLSGTLESARQAAARVPRASCRIFDTRSLSLGEGLMVLQAAKMARDQKPESEILAKLEHMRDHTQLYFILDTLDYLAKGGRIRRAARLMGTVMNMKPMIKLQKGALEPHARHISWPRALEALRALAFDQKQPGLHLGVLHGDRESDAKTLAEELRGVLKPDVLLIGEVGAAISTHGGPGSLGVTWYAPGDKTP